MKLFLFPDLIQLELFLIPTDNYIIGILNSISNSGNLLVILNLQNLQESLNKTYYGKLNQTGKS